MQELYDSFMTKEIVKNYKGKRGAYSQIMSRSAIVQRAWQNKSGYCLHRHA